MKHVKNFLLFTAAASALLFSCGKEKEKPDTEYPVIDAAYSAAFPQACSVIQRRQTMVFKARFTDNRALGAYSLDFHHNFDHHTHSTEQVTCDEDPEKAPVKPMLFIREYTIPENSTTYEATANIEIPADVDPGDYHFMIRLTDKEGWQTLRGISIKIN